MSERKLFENEAERLGYSTRSVGNDIYFYNDTQMAWELWQEARSQRVTVPMKRIAVSKVRQLDGDICGVLVRKDKKLAYVDEHGQVQWLQSGQGAEEADGKCSLPWFVHVYNSGYEAGHHDTVEGGFTPIHHSDMDTYHEEQVLDILEDLGVRASSGTQPPPTQQANANHWAANNPGLADQYRMEALAARGALGFGADDDCVSPYDIRRAVESISVPAEQGTNRYGLDMAHFRNLFNRELNRPLVDFRPDELARVLARAARTADAAVLQEPEFQDARAQSGKGEEPVAWMNPDNPREVIGRKKKNAIQRCYELGIGSGVERYSTPLYSHPFHQESVQRGIDIAIDMLEDYARALDNGDLDGAGHSPTQSIYAVIGLLTPPQSLEEGE